MIYFMKIQSENMNMIIFYMICNFFKCNDFTFLLTKYLLYRIVGNLLSHLCTHDKLILKLHQEKNSYLSEG